METSTGHRRFIRFNLFFRIPIYSETVILSEVSVFLDKSATDRKCP